MDPQDRHRFLVAGTTGLWRIQRAVWFGENRLLRRVEPHLPLFGVEEGVVPAAEEYAVVYGGGAAVFPVGAVVDVAPAGWSVAVGELAVLVS